MKRMYVMYVKLTVLCVFCLSVVNVIAQEKTKDKGKAKTEISAPNAPVGNNMSIYFDDKADIMCKNPTPDFPISRYDSRAFVWADAFYKGNYCAVQSSAQGQSMWREQVVEFLNGFKADKSHFNAFEVEIDGMRLHDYFEFENQRTETMPDGSKKHTVSLLYPMKNARIRVCTLLDGSSFIVRWLEIENIGKAPFNITGLFPMSGIIYPEALNNTFSAEHLRPNTQIGSFLDNHYLAEGEFFWQDLPKATLKFGFERALFNPPMYVIKNDVACQLTMIHIETTMMTQAEFTRGGDYYYARRVPVINADYVHFKVGADKRATCRAVMPGSSVVSPKIHIGQIYGDLDACVNEFNEHLRFSVIPKRNQPLRFPISYNAGGYANCQFYKQPLMDQVDIAAEVGAEMFIIDAGWFGSADKEWWQIRGDWYENELLENGLVDVFDYARKKGMMCGLWLEAEGMDLTSGLAAEHPEWQIRAYGKPLPTVNLLIPEAEEYVFNSICGIIDKYRLNLFRIDGGLKEPSEALNSDLGMIEGSSWLYFEKLYAIFERVRQKYPHLYFENCSGGGGRSDLGMMRRFDWMQATDNFVPMAQLRTVYGMTFAFAPEQILSISAGNWRQQTDPDFLARSSLFGNVEMAAISDKLSRINPYNLAAWKQALKLYREELRPMLNTCRIFHHTPPERYMEKGQWLALELASPDNNKSFTGIFRFEGEETGEYRFYPKGISAAKTYSVYSDNSREKTEVSGLSLIRDGYPIRLSGKLTSDLIIITAIK